jgi:hypothetical protein
MTIAQILLLIYVAGTVIVQCALIWAASADDDFRATADGVLGSVMWPLWFVIWVVLVCLGKWPDRKDS